jgi:hypothetical protein
LDPPPVHRLQWNLRNWMQVMLVMLAPQRASEPVLPEPPLCHLQALPVVQLVSAPEQVPRS